MQQTNPRIGNEVNEFEIKGLVRYGFRRYNTFKNKKPYLLFMVQQPFTSRDGKSRFRGYQMLCFNEQYAETFFNINQQVEVIVKGNISVETFTKDGQTVTVIKLLANEIHVVERLPFPLLKSKAEADKEETPKVKEKIEHTTVFQTSEPSRKSVQDFNKLTPEQVKALRKPGESEAEFNERIMKEYFI